MIALMRSATSTSLHGITREGSDSAPSRNPVKSDLDALRPHQVPTLSRSASMTNLEDAKTGKKAKLDAELKNALSVLRKPNREVVGKAVAEAAERRVSSIPTKSKSS